jgi:hypothetical protein
MAQDGRRACGRLLLGSSEAARTPRRRPGAKENYAITNNQMASGQGTWRGKMSIEDEKLAFERHKNIRDEQFWFAAAAVGFNGFLLVRAQVTSGYAIAAASVVSVFGIYLILDRWLGAANRRPQGEPNARDHWWWRRLSYTCRLAGSAFAAIPWVIAECSGSLYYIVLIAVSCCGVWVKYWSGSPPAGIP